MNSPSKDIQVLSTFINGTEIVTLIKDNHSSSVSIKEHNGCTELGDLIGDGDPILLLETCKIALEKAKNKRVILLISFDNPKLSGLIRLYKRYGFDPVQVMMELNRE